MATKTIGSNPYGVTGTGRDFQTFATWVTYFNALNIVAGGAEFANPFNDSEAAVAGVVLGCNNSSVDSSHFLTLKPAAGQGFSDNASVRTNALFYNVSNGVGLNDTATGGSTICCQVESPFAAITGLQMKSTDGRVFQTSASTLTINNCIFQGNEALVLSAPGTTTFNNCLFLNTLGAFNRVIALVGSTCVFNYCTFVAQPSLAFYVNDNGTTTYTNCAFFGAGTSGFNSGTPVSTTFVNCMTDISGTTGLTGGKTFANQFVNTTNDFRAKAGADLIGNGTPIGGITTDISGFTRSASSPTIGAWEVAPTATGVPVWLYFGQSLALGAGAKLARDLIRNPIRSRRRLFTGGDDR